MDFKKGLKSFACIMTAAYDTIWTDRLLLKVAYVLKCKKLTLLMRNMLINKYFKVNLKDDRGRWRRLNDGLI